MQLPCGDVELDLAMMPYPQFVPRLYNLCKSVGMAPGRMLPSLGFCSDENQGYPTIMVAKHFGTYPFNHGYIGGIMALDRHGPHAAHGEDMVIIHAPHVGYDPESGRYGTYRRKQMDDTEQQVSTCCGKIAGVLQFYREAYAETLENVLFTVEDSDVLLSFCNSQLLEKGPADGTRLRWDKILADPDLAHPALVESTSKVYVASPEFAALARAAVGEQALWPRAKRAIANLFPWSRKGGAPAVQTQPRERIEELAGAEERRAWRSLAEPAFAHLLQPSMFSFNRSKGNTEGERNRLERELLPHMPMILTSPYDAELTAALTCTQLEFQRSWKSVSQDAAYQGKNFMLVSGLNIDVSPDANDPMENAFPETMFLPWAAYVKTKDGAEQVVEQKELVKVLEAQSDVNTDAIDIENSITDLFNRLRKRVVFHDASTGQVQAAKVL